MCHVIISSLLCTSLGDFFFCFFIFQAEDGIRDLIVTGVQTCALPISPAAPAAPAAPAGAGPDQRMTSPLRPVNPFMVQDPKQKARRLARALVSDLVVYHPEKRQQGLRDGTLPHLFKDEIDKSWQEYVEQVGADLAKTTPFWAEALNEILAGGNKVFEAGAAESNLLAFQAVRAALRPSAGGSFPASPKRAHCGAIRSSCRTRPSSHRAAELSLT